MPGRKRGDRVNYAENDWLSSPFGKSLLRGMGGGSGVGVGRVTMEILADGGFGFRQNPPRKIQTIRRGDSQMQTR